jgi:hypothetical protein
MLQFTSRDHNILRTGSWWLDCTRCRRQPGDGPLRLRELVLQPQLRKSSADIFHILYPPSFSYSPFSRKFVYIVSTRTA